MGFGVGGCVKFAHSHMVKLKLKQQCLQEIRWDFELDGFAFATVQRASTSSTLPAWRCLSASTWLCTTASSDCLLPSRVTADFAALANRVAELLAKASDLSNACRRKARPFFRRTYVLTLTESPAPQTPSPS